MASMSYHVLTSYAEYLYSYQFDSGCDCGKNEINGVDDTNTTTGHGQGYNAIGQLPYWFVQTSRYKDNMFYCLTSRWQAIGSR